MFEKVLESLSEEAREALRSYARLASRDTLAVGGIGQTIQQGAKVQEAWKALPDEAKAGFAALVEAWAHDVAKAREGFAKVYGAGAVEELDEVALMGDHIAFTYLPATEWEVR